MPSIIKIGILCYGPRALCFLLATIRTYGPPGPPGPVCRSGPVVSVVPFDFAARATLESGATNLNGPLVRGYDARDVRVLRFALIEFITSAKIGEFLVVPVVLERGASFGVPDPRVRAVREEDPRDGRRARPVERRAPRVTLEVWVRARGEEELHDPDASDWGIYRRVRAHGQRRKFARAALARCLFFVFFSLSGLSGLGGTYGLGRLGCLHGLDDGLEVEGLARAHEARNLLFWLFGNARRACRPGGPRRPGKTTRTESSSGPSGSCKTTRTVRPARTGRTVKTASSGGPRRPMEVVRRRR